MFKVLILAVTTLVASAQYRRHIGSPAYYGYAPEPKPGPIYATYTDAKPVYESYPETPSPYSFGYNVDDGYGNKNHQNEEGDAYGNKKGSYGYTDAYGIYRKVDYVADDHGFRASISTNEPGVGDASPADVQLYAKEAPAAAYHAPAPYKSASYGAPIYAVQQPYASYPVPQYRPYRTY